MVMRRVPLGRVVPGMTLARGVHDARGQRLLAPGAELTPRAIEAIRRIGLGSVLAADGPADGIPLVDAVSEQHRSLAAARVREVIATVRRASDAFRGGSRDEVAAGLDSAAFRAALSDERLLRNTHDAGAALVRDIMGHEHLLEIAEALVWRIGYDDTDEGLAVDAAIVAAFLGRLAHLDRRELEQTVTGALLANIGQLFLADSMLKKAGAFTPEERDVVEAHPAWTYATLRCMGADLLTAHIGFQHHERQDGEGYPRGLRGLNRLARTTGDGLEGGAILRGAEIVALAETYTSLMADRPHRPALPYSRALFTIGAMTHDHLNSELVDRFLDAMPPFPRGMEVVLRGGKLNGAHGVVTAIPRAARGRPVVRLIHDQDGGALSPFEVALADEPHISVHDAAALAEIGG